MDRRTSSACRTCQSFKATSKGVVVLGVCTDPASPHFDSYVAPTGQRTCHKERNHVKRGYRPCTYP